MQRTLPLYVHLWHGVLPPQVEGLRVERAVVDDLVFVSVGLADQLLEQSPIPHQLTNDPETRECGPCPDTNEHARRAMDTI